MRGFLTILIAATLVASCGEKTVTKPPADGIAVGMARRDFHDADRTSWDGAASRPLATTIWYPAEAAAKMSEVAFPADNPLFVGGWAAKDAALADGGKLPLVVLSHGTGGSAFQMMWLGRRLAAKGFVVAAVDHHGNTAAEAKFDPRGFMMPWERALDISATIDAILDDSQFGPRIDASRIGAAGFSLGGYTVAALAGGMTSLAQFEAFCAGGAKDATCDPQPEYPKAAEEFAAMLHDDPSLAVGVARHKLSFADPRIKSFILIAPALGQAITDESLLRIKAPVLILFGDADTIVPPAANAERIASKIRTSKFQSFKGAGHYVFLNECSPKARKSVGVCRDAPGVSRAEIHDEAARLASIHFSDSLGDGRP